MPQDRKILGILTSLFFLSLLLSCAHSPPTDRPREDYLSLSRDQLTALTESDPESSLEALSALLWQQPASDLDEDYLFQLEIKAISTIAEGFEKEKSMELWSQAEASLSSLEAAYRVISRVENFPQMPRLGPLFFSTEWHFLLTRRAEDFYSRGLYAPAASYVHRLLDLAASGDSRIAGILDGEILDLWALRAQERKDSYTLRRISETLSTLGRAEIADLEYLPSSLAESAAAVVTVYVDKGLKMQGGLGFPDRVLGSAFQVDGQGYYLTNYHVIASEVDPEYEGYSKLSLRPFDNPEARVPARVVGWNEELDLAILKSGEIAVKTLYLHSLPDPAKGDRVYSIGSPVGLENSISSGIVSAPGRRILALGDTLQIDVPVNPGSSGGPLLDEKGRVVGVIVAGLRGYQGLNFALSAAWASTIFPELFEGGRHEVSWLGIGMARNLDSSIDISYVVPWRSVLRPGDRLLAIDGTPVHDLSTAQRIVSSKPLGSLAALELQREGAVVNILVKTEGMVKSPMTRIAKNESMERLLQGVSGMLLEHISGPRGTGGTYKVAKIWPGMPADESGLREADIIKFIRYRSSEPDSLAAFDLSVKSFSSGYLEKTLRMIVSLEMNNFL